MPRITFRPINRAVDVPPGTSILDAALDHGLPLGHDCGGVGRCTTCRVRIADGMSNLTDRDEEEGTAGDIRLSCQARVWGDVLVEIPMEQAKTGLTRERVEEVLNKIREYIAQDGGYVELVDINQAEGIVSIRFQGACVG